MLVELKGSKSLIEDFRGDLARAHCQIAYADISEYYKNAEPGSKHDITLMINGAVPFDCAKRSKYKGLTVVFSTNKGVFKKPAGNTYLKRVEGLLNESKVQDSSKAASTVSQSSSRLTPIAAFSSPQVKSDEDDWDETQSYIMKEAGDSYLGDYEDLESYEMRMNNYDTD